MAATEGDLRLSSAAASWRTPLVIIVCGCAIGMLSFGPRSSFGFFIQPMSREFSWGRDVFGLALSLIHIWRRFRRTRCAPRYRVAPAPPADGAPA